VANPRAILLMIAAMAAFATTDAFVKLAAHSVAIGQLLFVTSIGSVLCFLPMLARARTRLFSRDLFDRAVLLRTLGEVAGSYGFLTALSLVPLATASAILQAQPLAVTLAAAVFLGEIVGWRRWVAVALGFVGVMIILRPGVEAFDPNALWMILAIVGLSLRDIGTRVLPAHVTTPFVSVWAMILLALLGALMMPSEGGWQPVDTLTWVWLGGVSVSVTAAFLTITAALRAGEISAIAPFRYTRMVFALLIAYLVFGERPDLAMWLGTLLIIGSGLYAYWRERQRNAAAQVA
jgi:drug/metabolite transporter (DMT)-like permease